METRKELNLPVAVIGAGPVGLAAAAHLISRNIKPIVFERGSAPADAVRSWRHVRVFSPWSYNIDPAAKALLAETGWQSPDPQGLPTGAELLSEYLEPLARHSKIAPALRYNSRVTSIARKGFDKLTTAGRATAPFVITYVNEKGTRQTMEAAAVIDASGTWFSPNPMGTDGRFVAGEQESIDRIHYGIPDVLGKDSRNYAGKRTMVVGAGHSAVNAVLELLKLQDSFPTTEVVWSLRRNRLEKLFGGGLNDKLPARGELGKAAKRAIDQKLLRLLMPFAPQRVEKNGDALKVYGMQQGEQIEIEVDRIIVATGFRPDTELFRELRVSLDPVLEAPPTLAPLIDPNVHSCGTVPPHGANELSHPEPGFFIVGSKSYGRAPTFLMATGYEQVRSVVAEIGGDHEAASDVRLVLPDTGVCSAPAKKETASACCGAPAAEKRAPVTTSEDSHEEILIPKIELKSSEGCCGGPAPTAGSCCVKDHEAKLAGESGCGCGSVKTEINAPQAVANSCCAPV